MSLSSLTSHTCTALNTINTEQSNFFTGPFDAHKIGWVIAGATASVATIITLISVLMHATNYYRPKEQRQVLRILLMPAVYSIVSFFSYRYFRAYTYYNLVLVVYEAIVIAAFLMLLLQFIGGSDSQQRQALMDKEKRKIPFPFCCIRYRPSKPYFLHVLRFSVLQYSIFRPLISVIGVITEYYNVLCPTVYSIYFAAVWLDAFDFISISVALYGLIVFYALVRENLKGRSPLIKFLSIKGIIFVAFYQGFVFSILQSHGVIKATTYWTAANVADGLQALCICCEMVLFAIAFMFAFSWKEYASQRPLGAKRTNPFWAILDSLNYADFFVELWRGIVFVYHFILRRPGTRGNGPLDIDHAFYGDGGEDSGKGIAMSEREQEEKRVKVELEGHASASDGSVEGSSRMEENHGNYGRATPRGDEFYKVDGGRDVAYGSAQ